MDQTSNDEVQDSLALPSHSGAKHAYWKRHIAAWQASGLSQRAYFTKHHLASSSFYSWKRKFDPSHSTSKKSFVPVKVDACQTSSAVRLIHPSGYVVECQAGTDVAWLQTLMGLSHAS